MSALRLALVGRGIAHSRSPLLHDAGLGALGRRGDYALIEAATSAALDRQLARVRDGELHGLNVTTPWKRQAADVCDRTLRCDERGGLRASPADAPRTPVNTVFLRDGALCGTSTDGPGLGLALARAGRSVRGRRVALVGAGGAGAAIAHWLVAVGADLRWVTNRSAEPALGLAAALRARAPSTAAVAVPWRDAARLADAQLIIHASRVGHGLRGPAAELAGEQLAHLPWAQWADGGTLVDVVYGAEPTAAERCAGRAGVASVAGSGLAMLACQAALSLAIWADAEAPVDAMLAALAAVD